MIEEKKNNKLLVIILLVLGSIAVLVGICLLVFGKTDEKPKNDDNIEENNAMVYENTADTKLMAYEINETNKEFKLNGKSILLKKIEEVLYINNEEISSLKFGVDNIYLRKDYMIVEGGGQNIGYPYIINENGKIIEIAGGVLDNPNNSIEELHLENGKLVATKHADTDIKVEIVYDGVSASIKEASTSTTDNSPVIKTGKEELETENKKFEIGGKIYTLKYIEDGDNGAIYLNDKKVASIDGYVHIEASFIGKYLFIEWPGAQGGPFAWGYFDQNAKYYDISNNDPLIYKVSYEKGKMYCYIEDKQAQVEFYEIKKVELTLNGNKAIVKDNTGSGNNVVNPTPSPTLAPSKEDTFVYEGWKGSYGYANVTGYAKVTIDEKDCGVIGCDNYDPISINDVVDFNIVSTNSENFEKWWGNGKIIRFGCLKDGKISYVNYADEFGGTSNPKTFTLSTDLTNKILASNASNLITLKITKKKMTEYTGMPNQCDSDITTIEEAK